MFNVFMYYAAPGVGKGVFKLLVSENTCLFKKRCTQFAIMCNMPARREEQEF